MHTAVPEQLPARDQLLDRALGQTVVHHGYTDCGRDDAPSPPPRRCRPAYRPARPPRIPTRAAAPRTGIAGVGQFQRSWLMKWVKARQELGPITPSIGPV
ncbi:hypothetical protein AB0N93_33215 [Streptomyces sp. NPDC091267]|uniref:hypothetical protein n=1 Tax=Streptomyces sp. NPDC091267 TaxID=3155195 RepID=UPI003424C567